MQFIMENWVKILIAVIAGAGVGVGVFFLFKNMTQAQLSKIREWLLWAVTEAEKDLGNGTGQLKLRQVYDLFLTRYPKISMFVSFNTFSVLVDQALDIMRKMLKDNAAVQAFVAGGKSDGQTS